MNLIEHAKSPKPQTMELQANPLTIWLQRDIELQIEEGDPILLVAQMIEHYWKVDADEAVRIAGFWFAIGERRVRGTTGPWQPYELRTGGGRRYLNGSTAG